MCDVLIAGAGPAGALTALLLARQGARVRLIDRARFPRDKLCGDTLNPGALLVLARHLDLGHLETHGRRVDGMLLTGPSGVSVTGAYGGGHVGRALTRRNFDHWLLERAVAAGVDFQEGTTVTAPLLTSSGSTTRVSGVRVNRNGTAERMAAAMVIGADGRRSVLAAGLQLSRQPAWPRRWAVGASFTGVTGLQSLGEMHVRHGHYLGVAPLPDGVTNACLVEPFAPGTPPWRDPSARLGAALHADPALARRFASARLVSRPMVLGPLAVDVSRPGGPGLLLAGDAAGFIDPMTGDGIRYALVGAELAAAVAADVLSGAIDPWRAADLLAARRHAALAWKWRFNRTLRRLVAWPAGVTGAALVARAAPAVFAAMIRYAGDVEA